MQVNSIAVTKMLSQAAAGELVVARFRGQAVFCIVLGQNNHGQIRLGSLDPVQGAEYPFHSSSDDTACLSYGLDWVIDPIRSSETRAGNFQFRSNAGALVVDGNNWIVCFHPVPGTMMMADEEYFDLSQNSIRNGQPSGDSAPFLSWAVWENQAARERPGSQPLTTVTAVARNF